MNKRMTAAAAGLATVLTAGIAAGESAKEAHSPGLVEIMMATQSHHAKLWLPEMRATGTWPTTRSTS